MFRFSLRRMLVVFAVVAVGLASLLWANALLLSMWRIVTSGALLVALLTALLDRGRRRQFAVAFFLIGTIYSVTAHLGSPVLLKLFDQPAYVFGTAPLLEAAYGQMERQEYNVDGSDRWSSVRPASGAFAFRSFPHRGAFMSIGFDMFTLLFGYAGGRFAVLIYERRNREAAAAC